jgi:hypothetical protein
VAVVEGLAAPVLDVPVYTGSVGLSASVPQAVRVATKATVQDRAAIVRFNLGVLHL